MNRRLAPVQQSKTTYKGTRKRLRLLFFVMVCFLSWAGLTLYDQLQKSQANAAKLSELQKVYAETKQLNSDLKLELTRLEDPEYIGQIARRDQNMYLPGETSINVTTPDP